MHSRTPNELSKSFPHLRRVLRRTDSHGIAICSPQPESQTWHAPGPSGLKHYYVDSSTLRIMQHNRLWAHGRVSAPAFQFVYLMLPTPCNQRCNGCFMGQDKGRLPPHLSGPYFSPQELAEIFVFAREHGAEALVYGGGGELFTWDGAFDLIETANRFGLRMVIFTNGTLLSGDDVARLNELGVVLIVSLRDTVESHHNAAIGCNRFAATLSTLDNALAEGFDRDNRLAVEIPVTQHNERRVLDDFIPAMRALRIVPLAEEYIQICTSDDEKRLCHNFTQSRAFFEEAARRDTAMGYPWKPEYGQRIIAQPQCMRPLYSFAVFPSGDVMDCPSHSTRYGNMRQLPLHQIMYSDTFKRSLLSFQLCACSVFYTETDSTVPAGLPDYLDVLV